MFRKKICLFQTNPIHWKFWMPMSFFRWGRGWVLSLQSNIPYLPQNVPGLLWRWSCWSCFHQIGLGDVFFAARLAAPWQDGLLSSGQIYRWPHLIFQNTTEVAWHSTSINRDGVQKKKMMAQMKSCPMSYIYYHFVCIWVLKKKSYISMFRRVLFTNQTYIFAFLCISSILSSPCLLRLRV